LANTVILGVLSSYLDIEVDIWEDVLKKRFPPKLLGENINAFRLGRGV